MASTGGFSVLINVNENDFKEDITSFNEFQKIYLVQYRKIVNLGDLSRLSAQLIVPRIAIKSSIFARYWKHLIITLKSLYNYATANSVTYHYKIFLLIKHSKE